jgi:uncharacterized protein (DUF952 family)
MLPSIVYKIVSKTNWNNLVRSGVKICKGFDNDLTDGFIHMSTAEQLHMTFLKKYNNNTSSKNDYNLLGIDLFSLQDVKWEKAKNGLVYPHLYSELVIDKNILWVIGLENYEFNINNEIHQKITKNDAAVV